MPYKQFIKQVKGKKKWCTKNIRTKQVVCYSSPEKRKTGIRLKEAFSHGFIPTRLKRSPVFHPQEDIIIGRRVQPLQSKRTKVFPTSKRYKRKTRKYGYNKTVQVCPGSKIRSKGLGRGLGIGRARGPIGVPIGEKIQAAPIGKKAQKIFTEMTTDKDLNEVEYGGFLDFEKKNGKLYLEQFSVNIGEKEAVEMPVSRDFETMFHTHGKADLLIFSQTDVEDILANPYQKTEVLFHNGQALVLSKPKRLDKQKFLKEYKSELNKALDLNDRGKLSDEGIIKRMKNVLSKYNFKFKKYKRNQKVRVPLRKVY